MMTMVDVVILFDVSVAVMFTSMSTVVVVRLVADIAIFVFSFIFVDFAVAIKIQPIVNPVSVHVVFVVSVTMVLIDIIVFSEEKVECQTANK